MAIVFLLTHKILPRCLVGHWKMNLVTVAGYTACSRRFSHFGTYNISLSDTVSCWRPLPPQLPTSHDLDFQTWWNLMVKLNVKQNVSLFIPKPAALANPEMWKQVEMCWRAYYNLLHIDLYQQIIFGSKQSHDSSSHHGSFHHDDSTLVEDSKFVGREGTPCRVRSSTHDHPE